MQQDGRFGFVDALGQVVIEPRFDFALPFFENKALVIQGEQSGFVDRSGELVIALDLPSPGREAKSGLPTAFSFHDGMARCTERTENPKRYGYVDSAGRMAVAPRYLSAWLFGDGRGPVSLDGKKHGYIDRAGDIVIEPRFKCAMPFSSGRAVVQVPVSLTAAAGRKRRVLRWGAIDIRGGMVVEAAFKVLSAFVDGVAVAEGDDGRQFLLDAEGQVLLAGS